METEATDKNDSTAKVPKEMKLPEEGKNNQGCHRFHRRNTVGTLLYCSYGVMYNLSFNKTLLYMIFVQTLNKINCDNFFS